MLRMRCVRATGGANRARTSAGPVYFDESQGGLARVPEPIAEELVEAGRAEVPAPEELCAGNFLVRRRSGLGDVLCASAAVREVARLGGRVEPVCHPNYRGVWDGLTCDGPHWTSKQRVVVFDNWLELHPGRRERPAALCFGDWWNLDLADARPHFALTEEERDWGRREARKLRGDADRAVALFGKAGWPTRTYAGFLVVAHHLAKSADPKVAVIGYMDEVLPCCKRPPQVGVRQLAAMVAACDLVVCGDTGPMHLAAALGVPAVAVFCATSAAGSIGPAYDVTALEPEGMDCWPCWAAACARGDLDIPGSCVRAVAPERVVETALDRLRSAGPPTMDDSE